MGFELVVFRHGPAEERDPRRWPNDRERPLSPKGVKETQKAARGLAQLVPSPGPILASPAARAWKTAEILRGQFARPPPLAAWEELLPDADTEPVLARLQERRFPRPPIVVGHEPLLGELVALSIAGDAVSSVRLSRAGAARVRFPIGPLPGAGVLEWLLTRDQLSRL